MSIEKEITAVALESQEKSREDYCRILKLIAQSDLNYKGKCVQTLFAPKIFLMKTYNYITWLAGMCFSVFGKVIAQYMTDSGYRRLFGFPPQLEELILLSDEKIRHIPVSRIDFFLDEDACRAVLCEINTDGTSAMNEDRILGRLLEHNTAFQKVMQGKDFERFELFDSFVTEFLAAYKAYSNCGQLPHVAIIDFLDKGTVNEFERFKEAFLRRDVTAEVCDIRELEYMGGVLMSPGGMKIDAVYRRAVTADIMDAYADVTPFLQAVRDKAVCLIGGFHTQIVHDKRIFYILRCPETMSFLTEDERNFVEKHVPHTYLLSQETVRDNNVFTEKEKWLIKPCDAYASKGVYAGAGYDDGTWKKLVLQNTDNDYLLQQFIEPYRTINIDLSTDNPEPALYSNITGVFCYNEKPYGIYSRQAEGDIITNDTERAVPTILLK